MQAQKTELLEKFAVRLKAAMKRRAVTLHDVSSQCGVAVSTVGAWTQGKNWPQVEVQPTLAQFLETSVHFLIHGIPEPTEKTEYPSPRESGKSHVAEDQAPYGDAALIEQAARRDFEKCVSAAEGDVQRLHWIGEQVKAHLAVPAHWKGKRSGMVRVTLPSQTMALSTETGRPIPSPLRAPRSA